MPTSTNRYIEMLPGDPNELQKTFNDKIKPEVELFLRAPRKIERLNEKQRELEVLIEHIKCSQSRDTQTLISQIEELIKNIVEKVNERVLKMQQQENLLFPTSTKNQNSTAKKIQAISAKDMEAAREAAIKAAREEAAIKAAREEAAIEATKEEAVRGEPEIKLTTEMSEIKPLLKKGEFDLRGEEKDRLLSRPISRPAPILPTVIKNKVMPIKKN